MKRLIHIFLALLITATISYSQETDYTKNRTALIIGNSAYQSAPLKNPANDAKVIGETLRGLGFDVLEYTDLDKKGMTMAMRAFSEKLRENPGVGLFYYAGHGIQSDGVNYLVPVNSNVQEQFEIEFECVKADRALAVMELSNNPFNVVIMDACRNNPFRSFFRSGETGLVAPKNPPTGSIVAFATQPGKTASDGTGSNGLYTQELVKAMQTPGIPIEEVFKQVRINVSRMSDSKQVPQEWSSLMGDFYFTDPKPVAQTAAIPTQTGSSTVKVDDSEPEVSFTTAKKVVGSVQLTTMLSGILYMDGEVQNDGIAVASGYSFTMKNLVIGNHVLEIKGQNGTWSETVAVMPNQTTSVIAQITTASVNNSSGRELNSSRKKVAMGVLIPKDEGDREIYTADEVDTKAVPVGGMIAYNMFINELVRYPKLAKSAKIVGNVQVQFTVEKSGVITDIKLAHKLGYGCDEEALRVMNELAYCWKPATKNGQAVRQTMVLPVPFSR